MCAFLLTLINLHLSVSVFIFNALFKKWIFNKINGAVKKVTGQTQCHTEAFMPSVSTFLKTRYAQAKLDMTLYVANQFLSLKSNGGCNKKSIIIIVDKI